MPDLGKYAADVLLAYAVSIILILGFVVFCWLQSRMAVKRLKDMEDRREHRG
ncbi:heme exporter protein CcmD [Parasulfitobacter algicola]